jgi:hypothetical protein
LRGGNRYPTHFGACARVEASSREIALCNALKQVDRWGVGDGSPLSPQHEWLERSTEAPAVDIGLIDAIGAAHIVGSFVA